MQRAKTNVRGEPQVRATVLTIETQMQPANRALVHQIVIFNGRARSMNEVDGWRLVDLNDNTVTFVDDIARTYRTESIKSLVTAKRAASAGPLPDHTPLVKFDWTPATRVIQGVNARQALIRAGGYQRELWVADHPLIPSNLFAVLYASTPLRSRDEPMMKEVDDAIIMMKGFPLLDHAEMPYGKTKMVVDRSVAKIEQKDVPRSWFSWPAAYKPFTEPDAGRPPASSPQPNQKTPATESQSSATAQRTP